MIKIYFKQGAIFIMALLAMQMGFAAKKVKTNKNARYPLGCKDTGYAFKLRALDLYPESVGERHSMYFVYNKTKQPIKLHQMRGENSARNVHLNHVISPDRWAVLATSEKHLKYACAVSDRKQKYGSYKHLINCEEALKVCEFTRVRYGLNNRGNYWVVRSNTRGGAVREVVWYGIIPQ